jgi:serine/threonine-protein kinase
MADLIGKQLGKWIIDQELGRGGMGRVYLAHEAGAAGEGNGAPAFPQAAIKVLAAELAQESGFLERFQREIEVLRQLNHPHIVRLFDSGCQEGHYYFVMEYLPGRNFDEVLLERGRLPWKEVLDIALQICPALKHAHDHGIIHRDLKPQNLLRAEDGTVKLTDFGIAKVFAGKQLTITGGLVGTAEFLSPEQASGKPVTNRSDLYSFGVVLYTLLTGHPPFQGRNTLDLMHKHRYAQFDSPQRLVPDIPHDLDQIVCGLLEKDPAHRPANGLVLLRQFESFRQKVLRREQRTIVTNKPHETQAEGGEAEKVDSLRHDNPGPATLMSQLVRQELTTQQRGGAVMRFINQPWVLVPLFLVCVGLIVWGIWFKEKTPPDDGGDVGPVSEVQKCYQQAVHLYRTGDRMRARDQWQNLVDGFEESASEADQKWVLKAKKWLAELKEPTAEETRTRWASVTKSLTRARQYRDEGNIEAAERIWSALEKLFWDEPSVLEIVKKDRGR